MVPQLRSSKYHTLAEYVLRMAKITDGFIYPQKIQEWLFLNFKHKTTTNTISVCLHRLQRHGLVVRLGPRKWCHASKATKLQIELDAQLKEAARSYRQGRKRYRQMLKRRQLREFNELLS